MIARSHRLSLVRLAAPFAVRVEPRTLACRRVDCLAVNLAAGFLGIALSASMAAGQATRPTGADTEIPRQWSPASAPATGAQRSYGTAGASVEDQPIRRGEEPRPPVGGGDGAETQAAARRDGSDKPVASPQASAFELRRVALAVGAVVGLIFLLHWLAKRLFPGVAAAKSSQAVHVLARSVLAPKQQVLLLQIGRRVIVVGDSGAQMNALAQISDPDEVAALLGQIESEKRPTTGVSGAFLGLFGKARESFENSDSVGERIGESDSGDGDRVDESSDRSTSRAEPPPANLGLADAQEELDGLVHRVKELSQQFRRS